MLLDIAPHTVGVGLDCLQMQTKQVADTDDADQLIVGYNRQMSHMLGNHDRRNAFQAVTWCAGYNFYTAAQYRPSVVSDEDVSLMERILEGWRTHSSSLATPGNS